MAITTNGQRTPPRAVPLAKTLIILAYCAAYCILEAKAAPVISETGVLRYLSQFGYLPPVDPRSQAIISDEALSKGISEFQSFVGLNVTGNMDVETAHLMTLPRCGVKDKVKPSAGGRSKRYAFLGRPWPVKSLTYKISKYSTRLDRITVDREIARAFAVWSEYTDLTFSPRSGQVDIEIRFELGYHGDEHPFDGPSYQGGTELAHAFAPDSGIGGDAHFDDSEVWTIGINHGTNLFQVAAHEFGHALGLAHSQIESALMAPIYRSYEPNFTLHEDDIAGVQRLYGPKTKYEGFDICKDAQIDTIFDTAEGHVYVFKGKYYWRLTTNGLAAGYPKLIASTWTGLASNIDAAFTYKGWTYFFKGSQYWVYVGTQMASPYPGKIHRDFPGIPDNIGAATVWNGDGLIYFYKGNKIWRLNPAQSVPHKTAYPELISSWPGLPENVEAALSSNGNTYFFKGGAYYQFNDRTLSLDPSSPYETGPNLFGCRTKSNTVPWYGWW